MPRPPKKNVFRNKRAKVALGVLVDPRLLRRRIIAAVRAGKTPEQVALLTWKTVETVAHQTALRSADHANRARREERRWIHSAIIYGRINRVPPTVVLAKIEEICSPSDETAAHEGIKHPYVV
jgi:hypothetical protein